MLIVALVDKYYDIDIIINKLKNTIPDIENQPIFIAGKSESKEKIRKVIANNNIIVYDNDSYFDYLGYINPYISKSDKLLIDLKEVKL